MKKLRDKTEVAKEIIDFVKKDEIGYEDMQIRIERLLMQYYNQGKKIGEINATPKHLRK